MYLNFFIQIFICVNFSIILFVLSKYSRMFNLVLATFIQLVKIFSQFFSDMFYSWAFPLPVAQLSYTVQTKPVLP